MNGEGILKWIYRDVLERVFDSNLRTMALALRVSERTLQKALDNDAAAESMLVFEQMMEYCMQHDNPSENSCFQTDISLYSQQNAPSPAQNNEKEGISLLKALRFPAFWA